MSRITLVLSWLLLVVVAAGCSDDVTRERDYIDAVVQARRSLDAAYARAKPVTSGAGAVATFDERPLEELASAAIEARDSIHELDPPPRLEDADRRIHSALGLVVRGTKGILAVRDAQGKPAGGRASEELYARGTIEFDTEVDRILHDQAS
ncbi:MAG: hypothetical protein JWN72_315 [Thermoleophilia bacterium]|nr:hypothetical protein [Thermoleophilia bacterium]